MSAFRPVCRVDQVPVERGVAALVDGQQVALFRTLDGTVRALGNREPFSGAMVMSRGIVGTRGDVATVASPMFKQVFDLASGVCVDEPDVKVPVFAVQVRDGVVEVSLQEAERRPA